MVIFEKHLRQNLIKIYIKMHQIALFQKFSMGSIPSNPLNNLQISKSEKKCLPPPPPPQSWLHPCALLYVTTKVYQWNTLRETVSSYANCRVINHISQDGSILNIQIDSCSQNSCKRSLIVDYHWRSGHYTWTPAARGGKGRIASLILKIKNKNVSMCILFFLVRGLFSMWEVFFTLWRLFQHVGVLFSPYGSLI